MSKLDMKFSVFHLLNEILFHLVDFQSGLTSYEEYQLMSLLASFSLSMLILSSSFFTRG